MKQQLDTLVWIGAGSAESPADLISLAKRSILVEARELACNALKERFAGNSQVQIIQQCISSAGGKLNWYQYNLSEFSATAEASGLKALFPGLKLQQQQELETVALIPWLTEQNLGQGKHALLLDCPVQNDELLKALLGQNAIQFEHLYITTSELALYESMQTNQELIAELQRYGYQLEATDSTDPDLLVVHCSRNPLWQQLQNEKAERKELNKQLEAAKQQVIAEQQQSEQQKAELSKQLEQAKAQRADLTKQLEQVNQQLQRTKSDFEKKLAQQSTDNTVQIKLNESLAENLTAAKKQIEQLRQQNIVLNNRIENTEVEFVKLEAQLSLLQEIALREA